MIHENTFDVIVVGAGPAGTTAAYLLASKGFSVLILDEKVFPRDKLCGGLLTYKTTHLLDFLFKTPLDFLKFRQVIFFSNNEYAVAYRSGKSLQGRLQYPFHFTERRVYDDFWLKLACQAGAEFRPGEKVTAVDRSSRKVSTANGNEFYGKFIFGADGALSKVRKSLSLKKAMGTQWRTNLATALEVFISEEASPDLPNHPQLFFGYIPWGYAWYFPGKKQRIAGICGLNTRAGKLLKGGFNNFLNSLPVSPAQISSVRSHALPYGNYMTKPGCGRVLLLGDAGGLADPMLGEGIYYAHKSAQLAANAVIKYHREPAAVLKSYTDHLNRDIIAELRIVRLARHVVFSLPGKWPYRVLASLHKMMPRKCEELVQGQRSLKRPLNKIPIRQTQ